MNYEKIIDLDNVTLEDCQYLYANKGMVSILNDGHLITFQIEEETYR